MDENKTDKVLSELAEIKVMLKMTTEIQKRHNSAIYGNGKDGLVTRASLAEDNIGGLETGLSAIKDGLNKLSNRVSFNYGKMLGISIGVSSIMGLIVFFLKVVK